MRDLTRPCLRWALGALVAALMLTATGCPQLRAGLPFRELAAGRLESPGAVPGPLRALNAFVDHAAWDAWETKLPLELTPQDFEGNAIVAVVVPWGKWGESSYRVTKVRRARGNVLEVVLTFTEGPQPAGDGMVAPYQVVLIPYGRKPRPQAVVFIDASMGKPTGEIRFPGP